MADPRIIANAKRVWMDAGPFFRFAEAGKLSKLAKYLTKNGHWVADVANEIELRGSSPNLRLRTHASLQNLKRLGFPTDQKGATLTPTCLDEVNVIRAEWAEEGEHPKKHRGEIATVLHAEHLGGELAIIDDGDGRKLAHLRRVPTLSTTNLAAEMVVAGKLDEADGKTIYLSVQRIPALTEAGWNNALAAYRAAMSA